jgi:serine/threonine protein kinase
MPLVPGTRIGQYEIVTLLGAGGMGEVYRARDARLQRDVAIKIVRDLVGGGPDRVARFRREAQVLASLNHPHIGAIYGVEDAASLEHSSSSSSMDRRWPIASRVDRFRSTRRFQSPGRLPTRSPPRTIMASSIAT